jgi:hypothetical protein
VPRLHRVSLLITRESRKRLASDLPPCRQKILHRSQQRLLSRNCSKYPGSSFFKVSFQTGRCGHTGECYAGIDLLDTHITSNDQLTIHSKFLPGSTIGASVSPIARGATFSFSGKHLRHSRDHFELLLDCIEAPPPHVLSYDVRIRNTPMEQERDAARNALLETIKHLEEVVPRANPSAPLTLQAVTPYLQEFDTSFGREVSPRVTSDWAQLIVYSFGSRHFTVCIIGQWFALLLLIDAVPKPFQVRVIAGELVSFICLRCVAAVLNFSAEHQTGGRFRVCTVYPSISR